EVVDFEIVYAGREVPDMAGLNRVEQVGRRLLDIYPHLGPSGIFDAYRGVLETGEPFERDAVQETVVQDGVPAVITVRRRAVWQGRPGPGPSQPGGPPVRGDRQPPATEAAAPRR